jgi:hypothetical protein
VSCEWWTLAGARPEILIKIYLLDIFLISLITRKYVVDMILINPFRYRVETPSAQGGTNNPSCPTIYIVVSGCLMEFLTGLYSRVRTGRIFSLVYCCFVMEFMQLPDQTNWSGSDMYLIWKFKRYLVCSSIGILVKLRSKTSIFPQSNSYQIFWSDFNIKSDQQNIKCLVG